MPKLTKEQFAAMLDGRPLGQEMSTAEIKSAIASELIVCFGASYDTFEAYGKIAGRAGCWQGGNIYFSGDAVLSEIDAWYIIKNGIQSKKVRAIWWSETEQGEHCSWRYETDIPHATFKIFEGNELYCIGIVMYYKDIYPDQATPETQKPEPYD